MNKESKLNLNAGDYAISHCDSDKTYTGLEVHKMLCDAYIAGNNDTLEDDDERIKNSLINLIKMSNEVGGLALHKWEADEMLAWLEKQKGNIGGISPNWSEEDKKMLDSVIGDILNADTFIGGKETASYKIDWLQSLQDRVQPQPKQEWNEEEIEPIISDYLCGREHYGGMIGRLCHLKPKQKQTEWGENDKAFLDDILCKLEHDLILNKDEKDWLKSLRPQNRWKPSEEEIEKAAQEWDSKANFNPFYMTMENDKPTGVKQSITTHKESFIAGVNWILKSIRPQNKCAYNPYKAVVESIAEMCKHYDKASHSGLRDFYDNVKVKCKDAQEYDKMFPQNTWKPSKEQMDALAWALSLAKNCGEECAFDLRTLHEQLEKLKEELI